MMYESPLCNDVLLIGVSIISFAREDMSKRGTIVELCPGAKRKDSKINC